MAVTTVKPHARRTRRGAVPVHYHLRRYADLDPMTRSILKDVEAAAYIDPCEDPYKVNILTNRRGDPIEAILNHETLHAVLMHVDEDPASFAMDQIVNMDMQKKLPYHGFTDNNVRNGRYVNGRFVKGLPPSRFEKRPTA